MCGIAGLFEAARSSSVEALAETAAAMAGTLHHRGPDDHGVWSDAAAGISLAHRRLSIVDLSTEGHQPMVSASGRYVLDFNGEVYNHLALRRELEAAGHRFRGHSDTEVLVQAIDRWGLTAALERVNGMFALAAWDTEARELSLVRDRLGEKPLYWGRLGTAWVFGSELKALAAHPHFRPEVDRSALARYLRLSYIPAPETIYQGVHKVPAGHLVTIGVSGAVCRPWWDAEVVLGRAATGSRRPADEQAVDALDSLLADAVALRMTADVPLGAFLSGGVDSSVVVALMQAAAHQPVRTFTVGFARGDDPDLAGAAAVARHLGTDHTELQLSPTDVLTLVPRLPDMWDEPFADPSQLPTALMCAAARPQTTVALSGDGGDEVFGGYNRYVLSRWAWRRVGRVPRAVRAPAGRALRAASPAAWDGAAHRARPLLPRSLRVNDPGNKVHKLGLLLRAAGPDDLYRALVSQWDPPPVLGGMEGAAPSVGAGVPDATERMMLADTLTTLPDEMLTKVDRASMAASLEVRAPLLDHRVVEATWGLSVDARLRDGCGKWILRQVLYRHVPRHVVDRPKLGFDPPIAGWLRGPLRTWADELLAPDRLRQEGFLDPAPVWQRWDEHQSGRRNWDYALWGVLMFEAWLERWRPGSG